MKDILYSKFYGDIKSSYVLLILERFLGRSVHFYVNHLLQDINLAIICEIGKFCAAAMTIRKNQLTNNFIVVNK